MEPEGNREREREKETSFEFQGTKCVSRLRFGLPKTES